jgi:dTDP-4-amino-4,6-dideoxygalactose transaminase
MNYGPFAKQLRTLGDPELKYLAEVFERGRLSVFFNEGGMVDRFQKAFAAYAGANVALARNNGMCALAEAVSVSGAAAGNEIICDPVVHFGALAALYWNCIPRFCDVEADTYLMDPASLKANITANTKAVIVTHLWGLPARIDEIRDICRHRGLFLIEDCAHAVGARWKGQHVGTFGDLGMFSFQEFKQLSTGDGAMVTVRDPALAERMENVWAFSGESPVKFTLNWRMNEMTAAVGLGQLAKVDRIVQGTYNVTLGLLTDAIAGCRWLQPRRVPAAATQSGYWFACTWQGDRHGLDYARFKQLNEDLGIGLRFGFNETPPYQYEFFRKGDVFGNGVPYHTPPFTKLSDYRYRDGLCPVIENLMPRLVTVNLIFLPVEEARRKAALLRKAIELTEKG